MTGWDKEMENHTCAIISEPPMCFAWGFDEEDEACGALKLLILNRISLLQAKGITEFAVPVDAGMGLYAAETVNYLRETNENLALTCYTTCDAQAVKWPPYLRDRYFAVQERSSASVMISPRWTPTCELDAMLEAIDASEIVIAVFGSEEPQDKTFATAVRYAKKMGLEITIVMPPKIY